MCSLLQFLYTQKGLIHNNSPFNSSLNLKYLRFLSLPPQGNKPRELLRSLATFNCQNRAVQRLFGPNLKAAGSLCEANSLGEAFLFVCLCGYRDIAYTSTHSYLNNPGHCHWKCAATPEWPAKSAIINSISNHLKCSGCGVRALLQLPKSFGGLEVWLDCWQLQNEGGESSR